MPSDFEQVGKTCPQPSPPINLMMKEFDGVSVDSTAMLFLFLTPVFAPPLIAALGSLCVLAPRLRSDSIVLRRSGASVAQRRALLVWEAVVVSSTSGLLTLVIALFGVLSTNHVIHGDVFYPGWVSSILWGPFIGIIGVMVLAMLAIKFAIVTTHRQVRQPPRNSRTVRMVESFKQLEGDLCYV